MTKFHMSVAIALAALLLILAYFLMRDGVDESPEITDSFPPLPVQEDETEEEEPAPAPEPDEADLAVDEEEETGEDVASREAPEEEPAEPLPDLNDSDPYVYEQLSALENRNDLLQRLTAGQLVRKFVVLVDNVSRGEMPARDLPVLGPNSEFEAEETEFERYEMSEDVFSRYDGLIQTMTAVDTEHVVALYEQMAPLFEEAYTELGYPDSTFEETLSDALDQVLEAEVGRNRYELTLPSVAYEFADPALEEELSSVEKLLLRMGPENAAALQEKLREVRMELGL